VSAAFVNLITYPFRSKKCTALYNDVLYAAVRSMCERMTIAQSRYLNALTSTSYANYCKSNFLPNNTETIELPGSKDVQAHWIGSPNARHVILYFHGGGYTQPANEGNFRYLPRLVADMNGEKEEDLSVLMLAYTLAPEARYPTQLREAAATLSFLINEAGRSPSNIILSGDSAGGNLALSLLSHVLHTHSDVPAIKLDQPLGGALLYSPWTSFSTDFPSFDKHYLLDVMSPLALRKWAAMFVDKSNPVDEESDPGPVSGDAYTEACTNPASWWEGLHGVVSDVFVAYGGDEVLADPIRLLEKALKEGWVGGGGDVGRVVFIEGFREAHVQPVVDVIGPQSGVKSGTQRAIEEWYQAKTSSM